MPGLVRYGGYWPPHGLENIVSSPKKSHLGRGRGVQELACKESGAHLAVLDTQAKFEAAQQLLSVALRASIRFPVKGRNPLPGLQVCNGQDHRVIPDRSPQRLLLFRKRKLGRSTMAVAVSGRLR